MKTNSTIEFEESLEKTDPPTDLRPDKYTWDWREVSRNEKEKVAYQCQKKNCKIQLKGNDRKYIEVDHISGIRYHNQTKNLKVLCKLCHAMKDTHHKKVVFNISSPRRKLKEYLEKYGDELIKLGNPHVKTALNMIADKET